MARASSIARDITHRKEAETARRERDVLRSVAGLAAAGHEINNLLAVVMGQAQLLARRVEGAERRRIDEMLDAVWRIRGIVDRMKHINKIVLLDGPGHMHAGPHEVEPVAGPRRAALTGTGARLRGRAGSGVFHRPNRVNT